jgi:hypothetical protein
MHAGESFAICFKYVIKILLLMLTCDGTGMRRQHTLTPLSNQLQQAAIFKKKIILLKLYTILVYSLLEAMKSCVLLEPCQQ